MLVVNWSAPADTFLFESRLQHMAKKLIDTAHILTALFTLLLRIVFSNFQQVKLCRPLQILR